MGYIYGIYMTPPGISGPPFVEMVYSQIKNTRVLCIRRKPIFEVGAEGLADSIPDVSSESSVEPTTFCLLLCITAVPWIRAGHSPPKPHTPRSQT